VEVRIISTPPFIILTSSLYKIMPTAEQRRAYGRRHYQANKEYYKEKMRRWRAAHSSPEDLEKRREQQRLYQANWYEKNRAKKQEYYQAHKEARNAYNKAWYAKNREYYLAYTKANAHKYKERETARREANKEYYLDYQRRWRLDHPDYQRERYARKKQEKHNKPVLPELPEGQTWDI
jgi:hypothetical protein